MSNTDELFGIFSSLEKTIRNAKKIAIQKGSGKIKDFFKEFIGKFPKEVESIGFVCYTPYFNDGDTCEFSVDSTLRINGEWADDSELEVEINEDLRQEFESVVGNIPDSLALELFGDHCEVVISRDGTWKTEEYEHE